MKKQQRQGDKVRLTTNTEKTRSFDVPGEDCGWHTALYYFAEHIRSLSHGRINHKVLYSYIGTNGHYINHDNPTIRKRTAAVLSRLIHSRRYVEDFRTSYEKNPRAFDEAAQLLCAELCEGAGCDAGEAVDYFRGALWEDVERGLQNEREDGRAELNPDRIANEMHSLFAWCDELPATHGKEQLIVLASSYFHLMTFGYLDERLVLELADETPLVVPNADEGRPCLQENRACLIKYASDEKGAMANWWTLTADRPFVIGRYTDCDVIEVNPYVSRSHCRIVGKDGVWLLEDQGSRHGSRVLRDACVVYDSARDGRQSFELAFGDRIVLAGVAHYWFGALLEGNRAARR